jgi:FtsH-binding integral membrane protein
METNNFNNFNFVSQEQSSSMSKTFMASVFSWMSAALIITTITAYLFSHNAELLSMIISQNPVTGRIGYTGLGIAVAFSPLAFILIMGLGFRRLSYPVLLFLFLIFATVFGASLSTIFLRYTEASIYGTFAASAGMFGVMAAVGYTTKTDLTKFGALLFMALIGMIIASIVNIFMQSSGMSYIISFIGVLVFTGLTAYDVQKLKRIGAGVEYGTEASNKLVIWGALDLYLDFINLFIYMLRLFGDRK